MGGQLVVDGLINNGMVGNRVKILRTGTTGVEPKPVSGLVLTVHDDLGNRATLEEGEAGVYELVTDELERVLQNHLAEF